MPSARRASANDLASLVALFSASEVSALASDSEPIWAELLGQSAVQLFVSEADGRIVSTCMLITGRMQPAMSEP